MEKLIKHIKTHWTDKILGLFFRFAASGKIPAKWFLATIPSKTERTINSERLTLEIVSHCWKYAHLLDYQLSSLVNYPPTQLNVIVTVFYSSEDADTVAMLDFFAEQTVNNITWNWQELPKEKLFRRSIGRNQAALNTQADWVWFTDCDLVFHHYCLDGLAESLKGKSEVLFFPLQERITTLLTETDPILVKGAKPQVLDIDTSNFHTVNITRATGPLQITNGAVARSCGYCKTIGIYQKPENHWCKAYEDRAFRWLLRSQGVGIDIPGVYRIQHITKGRYKKGTIKTRLRQNIRRMREKNSN